MATLDDKLLGEKLHYYCSSSEEEDEPEEENRNEAASHVPDLIETKEDACIYFDNSGGAANTGPKGVINDFRRYRQLENEKTAESERERLELMKKLSLTCRTQEEDEKANARQDELDRELEQLFDAEFMQKYVQQRMTEMFADSDMASVFGSVQVLATADEFLKAVDSEKKSTTVVIAVVEQNVEGCESLIGCLECLARDYPKVKFCRIKASLAGLSKHFEGSGVPALLAYKNGQLVGNFIRLSDELGEDFYANELTTFLVEHGILEDKTLIPKVVKGGS